MAALKDRLDWGGKRYGFSDFLFYTTRRRYYMMRLLFLVLFMVYCFFCVRCIFFFISNTIVRFTVPFAWSSCPTSDEPSSRLPEVV
jgi:hypothetical protein